MPTQFPCPDLLLSSIALTSFQNTICILSFTNLLYSLLIVYLPWEIVRLLKAETLVCFINQ